MGAACLLGGAFVGNIEGRMERMIKSAKQYPTKVETTRGYHLLMVSLLNCPLVIDIFTFKSLTGEFKTFKQRLTGLDFETGKIILYQPL
jgi:hypothetical protein